MDRIARIVVWSFVGILAGSVVISELSSYSTVLPEIVGWSILFTLMAGLVRIANPPRVQRKRRAAIVLTYLEQAVRLNLPLPDFIDAAARSETGETAKRLNRLRRELDCGRSIADAVGSAVPEISRRTRSMLVVAEQNGQLPTTLYRLVSEEVQRQADDPLDGAFLRVYPPMMTVVLLGCSMFILVFVLPKFQQIFRDFHVPLPGPTQRLVALSSVVSSHPLLLLAVMAAALFWLIGTSLWRPRLRQPILTGWLHRDRDLADVCRVVADATRVGAPLPSALQSAAGLHVSRSISARLLRWSSGIESGLGTSQAAAAAGLPPMIANLAASGDLTAATETFDFLARYYQTRFSRSVAVLRGAFMPLMVFAFAVPVFWLALSLFLPLVRLIDISGPYRSSL